MYIKHLVGARAGETEDLPFTIARDKVLRGEAEDVYDQMHLKEVATVAAPVVQPQVLNSRVDSIGVLSIEKKKGKR